VVKADAYGLGASAASKALAEAGARVFFTATAQEALEVRRALGEGPQILVLNGPDENDVAMFGEAKLIPVLNSLRQIKLWDGRARAGLHIDTGMNRLGVGPEELAQAAHAWKDASPALVMSHLACGSEPKHEMNKLQRARFIDAASLFPKAPLSLAATGGALSGEDFHFDLLRIGVGLYGSGALEANNPTLSVAATIDAPILQVREVEAGESFGYGATVRAAKKMRTATVALGYADGFLRSLGGRGYGVLDGQKLPILGRISMDLIIVDVTDAPAPRPGAMVEFLGAEARLDDVARLAGAAPYEILTSLVGTVARHGVRR